MAKFTIKTKNQNAVREKPRVYFTSHPDDFEPYFERICHDIFKTQDCAIYYTDDLREELSDEDFECSLQSMNIFVVPITYKLLTENNRAILVDIPYAIKEGIPILPLMMESKLDLLYSKENKFGKRQYIAPHSTDLTSISYEKKLAAFLETKLSNDELRKKIRQEFDAYIFLSYRKLDRAHANELLRLIHSIPQYRDLAIWYDEFITLGENFQDEIDHALAISRAFALLVTPHLLDDPNFVKDVEYKAANGKLPIIPVEMEETDKDHLAQCYDNIPKCVDPDLDGLRSELDRILSNVSVPENNSDPKHCYLIGLAYLNGIDVEVNRERGIELITAAAEGGYAEAMHHLNQFYMQKQEYDAAVHWGKKMYEYFCKQSGEEDDEALSALNHLIYTYLTLHDPNNAFPLCQKSYELHSKIYGEKDVRTLACLSNLAQCHKEMHNEDISLEMNKRSYELLLEILGEKSPETLIVMCNLASSYGIIGDNEKQVELLSRAYSLLTEISGESERITLIALSNLAFSHSKLNNHEEAIALQKKAYETYREVYGDDEIDTINALSYLALIYDKAGFTQNALECYERAYLLYSKTLGDENPNTLYAIKMLKLKYFFANDYPRALAYSEKEYILSCKINGDEHEYTLEILDTIAFLYRENNDLFKSLDIYNKLYKLRTKTLGEEHPDTLAALHNLSLVNFDIGISDLALEMIAKAHLLREKVLGEDHPDTVSSAIAHLDILKFQVVFMAETEFEMHRDQYGEEHPNSLKLLRELADAKKCYGNPEEATVLYRKEYEIRARLFGEHNSSTLEIAEILNKHLTETKKSEN